MLTTRTKWNFVLAGAILAIAAVPAFASPIVVSNFSFELPTGPLANGCGTGCSYSSDGALLDWTVSSGAFAGRFQPGADVGNFTYFNSLSDGITSAYSNTPGSIISQDVAFVALNQIYTLQVAIGARNDQAMRGQAALLINGNTYLATGTPFLGGFSTYTATYIAQGADLGAPITIELLSSGGQANFDNVRLDASLTPEPAPFLLIGSALLLLQALGRRRSNSKTKA